MKVIATAMVVFVGGMGLVIGYRMEQQTMAILAGTAVGFIVAAFAVGSIAFVVLNRPRNQTNTRENQQNVYRESYNFQADQPFVSRTAYPSQFNGQSYPTYFAPDYQIRQRVPMYAQQPAHLPPTFYGHTDPRMAQAQPYSPYQPQAQFAQPFVQPRRFMMIGGSGQSEEITPSPEEMQSPYEI